MDDSLPTSMPYEELGAKMRENQAPMETCNMSDITSEDQSDKVLDGHRRPDVSEPAEGEMNEGGTEERDVNPRTSRVRDTQENDDRATPEQETQESGPLPDESPHPVSDITSIDLTLEEDEDRKETRIAPDAGEMICPELPPPQEMTTQSETPKREISPEGMRSNTPALSTEQVQVASPATDTQDPLDLPIPSLQDILAAYVSQDAQQSQTQLQPAYQQPDPLFITPTYQDESPQIPPTSTAKPVHLHEDHPMRLQMTINPETLMLTVQKPGPTEDAGYQATALHTAHFPQTHPTDDKTTETMASPLLGPVETVEEVPRTCPELPAGGQALVDDDHDDDKDQSDEGNKLRSQKTVSRLRRRRCTSSSLSSLHARQNLPSSPFSALDGDGV